jgi:transcription termination/antitermination protein NusG
VADQSKDTSTSSSASSLPPHADDAAGAGQKRHLKWYVVQVYSGFEQKVKLSLAERIKQASMDDSFGEVLIPTETVQDGQGGRRVSSKTFYPGYIFVQMAMTDEAWHVEPGTSFVILRR